MRITTTLLALVTTGILLAGCSDSRNDRASGATQTPTATSTATVAEALADAADVPGCTRTGEGSFYEGSVTRSFDCAGENRLTNAVVFHKTLDEARKLQDNVWGTRDGATEQIRRSLTARPVNLDSRKVTDVTESFGKLGAEQENVWCATYTDQGGTIKVTEFYGAFRYKSAVVAYTSIATDGAPCDGPSDSRQYAQTLAQAQLAKLKASMP